MGKEGFQVFSANDLIFVTRLLWCIFVQPELEQKVVEILLGLAYLVRAQAHSATSEDLGSRGFECDCCVAYVALFSQAMRRCW